MIYLRNDEGVQECCAVGDEGTAGSLFDCLGLLLLATLSTTQAPTPKSIELWASRQTGRLLDIFLYIKKAKRL